jgi:hypothetical protein
MVRMRVRVVDMAVVVAVFKVVAVAVIVGVVVHLLDMSRPYFTRLRALCLRLVFCAKEHSQDPSRRNSAVEKSWLYDQRRTGPSKRYSLLRVNRTSLFYQKSTARIGCATSGQFDTSLARIH